MQSFQLHTLQAPSSLCFYISFRFLHFIAILMILCSYFNFQSLNRCKHSHVQGTNNASTCNLGTKTKTKMELFKHGPIVKLGILQNRLSWFILSASILKCKSRENVLFIFFSGVDSQSPLVQVLDLVQREASNSTTDCVHTVVCLTLHIQF
jgi:hypothetical protein